MEPLSNYIILSAAPLGIGIHGLVSKRNAIPLLFSVDFMVNATNINFAAFARYSNPSMLTGWNIVFFSIAAGIAFRLKATIEVRRLNPLRG